MNHLPKARPKMTMMEPAINFPALLTELSEAERCRHNIHSLPEEELFSFLVACYTKECKVDPQHGIYNRQIVHRKLYEMACNLNKNVEKPWPFDINSHAIELVHDDQNIYDKTAMMMVIKDLDGSFKELDGYHLGYVPMCISKILYENQKAINLLRISSPHSQLHGTRWFGCTVVAAYGNQWLGANIKKFIRFTKMMEEG